MLKCNLEAKVHISEHIGRKISRADEISREVKSLPRRARQYMWLVLVGISEVGYKSGTWSRIEEQIIRKKATCNGPSIPGGSVSPWSSDENKKWPVGVEKCRFRMHGE